MLRPVDATGNVVDKASASISEVAGTFSAVETKPIIINVDGEAPLADGTQTLHEYLNAIDTAGHTIVAVTNSVVISKTP